MLSVPEEILVKKGPLNEAESAIVRRHIEAAAEILRDDRHPRIFLAREIARYHHAHWDGLGYPERVGGRFIPQAARICAIADAYDEMVSGLGGRPARSMDEALAALRSEAGRRFDPELVGAFRQHGARRIGGPRGRSRISLWHGRISGTDQRFAERPGVRMKATGIDTRGRQMLELLSEGASARVIARKLGYSEGTTRVYLHNLYRQIGVRNKTEAVIWYLNRSRAQEPHPASHPMPAPAMGAQPAGTDVSRAMTLGDMALAEDLYTALGAMGSFLGPFGHVWEAGLRLKGEALDENLLVKRAQSRLLWRALLKGDFAYGKLLHDEGIAERLVQESPSDALLVACLLLLGGYSSAYGRFSAPLLLKRKGAAGITAREAALLRAVHDALEGDAGLTALHEIAADNGRPPMVKQTAMAALFHVYRMRRDADRARATASAVWADAESARQQLEAMGVRPLPREHALPRLVRAGAKEAAPGREKATVTR